jgi:hypothetical protein
MDEDKEEYLRDHEGRSSKMGPGFVLVAILAVTLIFSVAIPVIIWIY